MLDATELEFIDPTSDHTALPDGLGPFVHHDVEAIGRSQSAVQMARRPGVAIGLGPKGDLGFHDIELVIAPRCA